MYKPQLVEEMNFEDEVSSVSMSGDGNLIALAIPGLLGVYAVDRESTLPRFVHLTSYVLSEGVVVKTSYFSKNNDSLVVITSDGMRRELSVFTRDDGFMKELYCTPVTQQVAA